MRTCVFSNSLLVIFVRGGMELDQIEIGQLESRKTLFEAYVGI